MQAKNHIGDVANRVYFGGPTFLVLAETGIGLGCPPPLKYTPVAKWLGHRSVDITFGTYWDVDGQDVAGGMNIPWLTETEGHRQNLTSP